MATKKQKNALIQALKFTPREIEINLWGYGGEIVVGRISEEAYDFWKDRDDLADFVMDWDGEFDDVPADARFITDGSWYEVDDICHENGCEASEACHITIDDCLEGQTIFECNTDLDAMEQKGIDVQNHQHFVPEETEPDGTCVFMGQSIEKGTFFSGRVRITEPFDPRKLTVSWNDCNGWRLVAGVEYAGEEVDGYDAYSTSGKSTEFRVYQVDRDEDESWDPAAELDKIVKDIPVMEGEEIWASEAIDTADEVELWEGHELTPWWSADDVPVREGRYQVLVGTWPFPSFADYTKRHGWRQHGEFIENLKSWRGLTEPPTNKRI